MRKFRIVAYVIPQLLVFLFFGGKYDLIFGFNHLDNGFTLLVILFLLSPLSASALMLTEMITYYRKRKRDFLSPSLVPAIVSVLLVMEAITIDLYILSLVKM